MLATILDYWDSAGDNTFIERNSFKNESNIAET